MYAASDRFKDALRRSHTVALRAEVLNSTYDVIHVLRPTSFTVHVDSDNAIRRRGNVDLVDPTGELTPNDATDLLHPLSSNRIRLFRGIRFGPGDEEYIALGIFDIFDNEIQDSGDDFTIGLKIFDLSKTVSRLRLAQPYVVPAGTRYDEAIRALLSYKAPWLSFNFPVINAVTPDLVFGSDSGQGGGDPWKYATEMAEAVGHELYIDIQGFVQLVPVANPKTDPIVWEYHEGERSQLLHVSRNIEKEQTYNHVYVYGESAQLDEPVSAEAIDDDPLSPTYYLGPYGDVPTFMSSEYIRTTEQAQTVADARLRQVIGATEQARLITTVNPLHETGDVVSVVRARAGVNSRYVIDKFEISSDVSRSMNISLREVRV